VSAPQTGLQGFTKQVTEFVGFVDSEFGGLATAPKLHQAEGLRWLQDAFIAGAPGVLLADT
jgi:hypothetical protein